MRLIGVPVRLRYLDDIDDYITKTCPEGIESLMVELPGNWPEYYKLSSQLYGSFLFLTNPPLFEALAFRYENKGTRIIYGDTAIREEASPDKKRHESLKSLQSFLAAYYFSIWNFTNTNKRTTAMSETIRVEKPDVVVVSRLQADRLKEIFPDSHYVAFVESRPKDFWDLPYHILWNLLLQPNNPNKTVVLEWRPYYAKSQNQLKPNYNNES